MFYRQGPNISKLLPGLYLVPMFKALAITLLTALLLGNVFIKSTVLLEFKINQLVISETFCVEKDLPASTCEGKCHLSKQLKKIEGQSENGPVLPPFLLHKRPIGNTLEDHQMKVLEHSGQQLPRLYPIPHI
ncbi:MAG: hypothetical protein ACI9UR_000637 [Bacteroidia bacterium]|jgi:hypothetical protein